MTRSRVPGSCHGAFALGAIALVLAPLGPTAAAAGSGAARTITVTAESRPLKLVLEDIAGQAGMRVRVSPRITTPINGAWTGPADRLFHQFVRSMNLVVSQEGGVTSVYAASEVGSDSFATTAPAAVVGELRGQTNAHNRVTAGRGMVHASGTPAFLAAVERVAARIRQPAPAPPVAPVAVAAAVPVQQPAAPATAPVTSPALAAPALYQPGVRPASEAAGYDVVRIAPRGGYEIRAYRLRYEQAADRTVRIGDSERIEPGVASRVRAAMGLGTLNTTRRQIRQSYVEARPAFPEEGSTVNVYPDRALETKGTAETTAIEGPTVTADAARNMVFIRDLPARMPQYEALINQFDMPRHQIEVEVAIIDVSVDKAREYGIDFGLKISSLVALFGGVGPTGALAGAGYITNDGNAFLGRINGLEQRGIVRVSNRFTMLIRENATESYTNMAEVAREVEGRNGYLAPFEAGTRITATPRIMRGTAGKLATMVRIEVEDAAFIGVSDQKIPTRRVTAFAGEPEVPEGMSVMIAGQTSERTYESRRKTPILGDIPLAGELFKKGKYGAARTERLFLITPRIMANPTLAQPTPTRAPTSFDEMDRNRASRGRGG